MTQPSDAHDAYYEAIRFAINDDGVATLTLNRPDVLNSFNATMRREILHAINRAPHEGARVIVITAAGRAFCAGQDLGEARRQGQFDLGRTLRDEYEPILRAILDSPLPVVAAVQGTAAGAGVSLALAADIVLAAEEAEFTVAFARIGLVPDVGLTYFLPRLVGLPLAMGLAMTTAPITGREAAARGLIWRAVPAAALAQATQEQAWALAQGPGRAYALMKRALRQSLDNDLTTQLALEAESQTAAGRTHDFVEGVASFLERRPPNFEGR